jgi:hypothetical protein
VPPATIGAPLDENCSIAPGRVDYFTSRTAKRQRQQPGRARPRAPTAYPAAMFIGDDEPRARRSPTSGASETRTINGHHQIRGAARSAEGCAPNWANPPANWKQAADLHLRRRLQRRLYQAGKSTGGSPTLPALERVPVASSSLNVFGNTCNDLTTAESMEDGWKERFIELRPPAHTQASAARALLSSAPRDKPTIIRDCPTNHPAARFPERSRFATSTFITDSWLLADYFTARAAAMAVATSRSATLRGYPASTTTAPKRENRVHRIDPKKAGHDDCRLGAGGAAQ